MTLTIEIDAAQVILTLAGVRATLAIPAGAVKQGLPALRVLQVREDLGVNRDRWVPGEFPAHRGLGEIWDPWGRKGLREK